MRIISTPCSMRMHTHRETRLNHGVHHGSSANRQTRQTTPFASPSCRAFLQVSYNRGGEGGCMRLTAPLPTRARRSSQGASIHPPDKSMGRTRRASSRIVVALAVAQPSGIRTYVRTHRRLFRPVTSRTGLTTHLTRSACVQRTRLAAGRSLQYQAVAAGVSSDLTDDRRPRPALAALHAPRDEVYMAHVGRPPACTRRRPRPSAKGCQS